MKHNLKNAMLKFAWLFIAAMVAVTACKKDDDPLPKIDAEDGVYLVGAGTALTDFDPKGLMKAANNEVGQTPRAGLFELYIAVKAGAEGFNIVEVTGGAAKTYGPGSDFAVVEEADKIGDEPRGWFSRGSLAETATKFTVPEDGLYHVVYDRTLNKVVVARVEWGIIGGANPVEGWSTSAPLTPSAFSLTEMSFQKTEFIMVVGDFKFRYSNGWKIVLDGEVVRINTNFGGTVAALVPGGADISNSETGYFTVTVNWSLANGTTASVVKTGDYTPPSYPDEMYVVGGAAAWGWPGWGDAEFEAKAKMIKMPEGRNEGLFWRICHLEADQGFKLSASNWAEPNIDYGKVDEWDADGITVVAAGNDWTVETSGMYIIVLNLRDNLIKVSIKPVEVYGIGDAFGTWDEDAVANKFTVDDVAKTVTSPALAANGNIRMYADHPWIPDWWHAEFRVAGGVIEYRGSGGDQDPVPGTAGQVITLNFDDNTGSIAK